MAGIPLYRRILPIFYSIGFLSVIYRHGSDFRIIGIYEIFLITEDVGRLIFANETSGRIREQARRNGMRSLRDDAMRKAEAGISSLEEVIFVTLRDDT